MAGHAIEVTRDSTRSRVQETGASGFDYQLAEFRGTFLIAYRLSNSYGDPGAKPEFPAFKGIAAFTTEGVPPKAADIHRDDGAIEAPDNQFIAAFEGAGYAVLVICPSGKIPTSFPFSSSSCAVRSARTAVFGDAAIDRNGLQNLEDGFRDRNFVDRFPHQEPDEAARPVAGEDGVGIRNVVRNDKRRAGFRNIFRADNFDFE